MSKTIICIEIMWREILNIAPSCKEYFLNFESLPGNGKAFIACAGVSHLSNTYQIGKTGKGEYFNTMLLIPAGTPFLYELDAEHWDMCWLLLHDCPEYQFIHQLKAGVWHSDNTSLLYQTMSLIRDFDHNDGRYQSDIQLRLIEVLLYQIEQTPPHKVLNNNVFKH